MADEAKTRTVQGWQSQTSTGSTVWVGFHKEEGREDGTVCFRFISKDGTDTKLAMGVEAARLMVSLTEKVLPEISDPHYKLLVKFVGEAAEKLSRTGESIWQVIQQTQPCIEEKP